MSISQSLNNAVSGLTATSRMAEVVSSNLSNALTEGYARRVLDVSSQAIGGEGGGVTIDGVRRIVDKGLIGNRRLADAALANQQPTLDALQSLESLIGTVDDAASLSGRLVAFEQALTTAAGDPASDRNLSSVVSALKSVTDKFNDSAREIQRMRQDADAMIARDIDQLNTSLF